MRTTWRVLVFGCVAAAAVMVVARAEDVRFSQRLSVGDQTEAGLAKLSADQLAVLDALIRRDEKLQRFPDTAQPTIARFSLRLSIEERRTTGLERLTDPERARLDALVAQEESGTLPAVAAGSPGGSGPIGFKRPAPEIHGMISFTYGAGSGGYREIGGSVVLDYEDPAHDFSLLVGYEEMRISGPFWRRGGWIRHPIDDLPSIIP